MCTVSWLHQPGGYHLLCNRDEKLTRGAAISPQVIRRGGVRFVAPIDRDGGGTWIAVNEFGLSVCLLNAGPTGRRSRGLLVRELAWAESLAECALWLSQLDLRPYGSFTLLMIEPDSPAIVEGWNGAGLSTDKNGDARMPLISSSYDPSGVHSARMADFGAHLKGRSPDAADLYWFHRSHGTRASAYSACMHRSDAETVSFSWAVVTPHDIRFLYSPSAPCQWSPSEQQVLTRAA